MNNPVLTALRAKRAKLASERDAVLEAPEREQRNLTDDEASKFDSMRGRIAKVDLEIIEAEQRESRQDNVDRLAAQFGQGTRGHRGYDQQARHISGGTTYSRDPHGPSWLSDMVGAGLHHDSDAVSRLRDNNREVATATRALSTTDAAGGDFVPPLYLINEYVEFARAARVVANQIRLETLPAGTDTINLPRITSGTAVAEQTVQNTAVQNTDAVTDTIAANVATIAGQQVLSLQLIEQSPINMDRVLLPDLLADLAQKTDIFVISNNATGKKGLLSVSGINSVTATQASPTVALLYPRIADAIQQVITNRFMPPDKILMHPRRWAWFMAAADTSNRPLVLPEAGAGEAVNAIAVSTGAPNADGLVGSVMGLPVYVDANIPTNLGAGTNEDRIIVLRSNDSILFEGVPRAELFRDPLAAQLSVLLRAYNYVALHASRLPKSISVISGTTLVTPSFGT